MNSIHPSLEFHVAPPPRGDDTSPGTAAQPFASLERARQALHAARRGQPGAGVVYLHAGLHLLEQPLTFGADDSGCEGQTLTYRNWPGEEAQILVGRRICGWSAWKGPIYRARVEAGWSFNVLVENGERAVMARWPQEGYTRVGEIRPERPNTFTFPPGQFPTFDPRNAQIFYWIGKEDENWFSQITPLAAADFERGLLTPDREDYVLDGMSTAFQPGQRYFLQGAPEFLAAPGQWALDRVQGYVYYWPRRLPIEAQIIAAPACTAQVILDGATHLRFEGLSFLASDLGDRFYPDSSNDRGGIFDLRNSRQITLRGCQIFNAGLSGLVIDSGSADVSVEANWFKDIGYTGVYISGGATRIRVSNNRFDQVGVHSGHSAAVLIDDGTHSEISHNQIRGGRRYGISCKTDRSHHIKICHNDISGVIADSQDAGAIEQYRVGDSYNVIENNFIHDVTCPLEGQIMPIYIDDASNHVTIRNNICCRISCPQGMVYGLYIKGHHNTIVNNILDLDEGSDDIIMWAMMGLPNDHLVFQHNIIYSTSPRTHQVYEFWDWSEDKISLSDDNLIFHASGQYGVGNNDWWQLFPGPGTWEAWQQMGFDRRSLIGCDPLFVDRAGGDYRLQPASPAWALGIQWIHQDTIGLRPDFPTWPYVGVDA